MAEQSPYDSVVNFNENEECEVVLMVPYLAEEFKSWLKQTKGLKEKSAEDYLRAYESLYTTLYEELEVDLYALLRSFINEIPQKTGSDLTKDFAPQLVDIYLEAMQAKLNENKNAFKKNDLCVMKRYHDFIVDVAGSSEDKVSLEKSKPLPDEKEFIAWLGAEYRMDYNYAKSIVSSITRTDLVLPSLVKDPMSFLDVLRAIPEKGKRENYIAMVNEHKGRIKPRGSYKTIQNGLLNISYYIKFLNSKL